MPQNGAKKRRRRAVLFKQQGGLCFWCQEAMILIEKCPPGGPYPLKLCTVDHLRDRFDPSRRERIKNGEQRWVAACWECNNRRGSNRQATISVKTLHRRSKRHPMREAAE